MPVRRSRLSHARARRSPARNRRSYTTIGLAAFVLVCAVAYILVAKNLGSWFAERLVLPSIAARSTPAPTAPPDAGLALAPSAGDPTAATDAADPTPAPTATAGTETVRITLPELTAYAVQLGAYSTKEAAESAAKACMDRSGAGYIVEDGTFRVLAAAYRTEAEAKSVQQQLLSGQSIESYLYKLSASEATLNITASAATAESIKASLSEIRDLIDEYGNLALALDAGEEGVSEVAASAQGICERARAAAAPFERAKKGNEAVDGLASLFDRTVAAAEATGVESGGNKVAVSSQIKYNYIDLLCAYADTIDALARYKASGA